MPPFDIIDDTGSQRSVNTEANSHLVELMCERARDESNRLRQDVCALQIRVEELEEERNFHVAKANELTGLVKINKSDEMNAELIKKTLEVAELKNEIRKLKADKEKMTQANARCQRERDSARRELQDLSIVVRSLQTSAYSEEESYGSDDEGVDDEEEIELTAEKALDMTLSNMKAHIEVLEDALQTKTGQCSEQKKKIARLQRDNEMNLVKIDMLEELFRELNQNRTDEEVRKDQEVCLAPATTPTTERRMPYQKSLSVPSLKIGERMRRSLRGKESHTEIPSASSSKEFLKSDHNKGDQMKNMKICFRKAGLDGMYTGPVMDGLPHGVGTIRFTNGDTYLGEMKSGKMAGKGTLYTKTRGIFRGRFENNKFLG